MMQGQKDQSCVERPISKRYNTRFYHWDKRQGLSICVPII